MTWAVILTNGWLLFRKLSNGTKSGASAGCSAAFSGERLMPLVRSARRNAAKNQILFLRIGPPSDRSYWFTDCAVGRPPGALPPLVLSLFHSTFW